MKIQIRKFNEAEIKTVAIYEEGKYTHSVFLKCKKTEKIGKQLFLYNGLELFGIIELDENTNITEN